jgi:hypothetical protein
MLSSQTKEAEIKRVNKEMANIRNNFKAKKIDGYLRRKYVAKLCYMFMLGYEVDFGCIRLLLCSIFFFCAHPSIMRAFFKGSLPLPKDVFLIA